MTSLTFSDCILKKAYLLAYFIHLDKEVAIQIVLRAAAILETAINAQSKRLYYRPTGRYITYQARSDKFRNKVTLTKEHLLQLLIFIESEPYEKKKEQNPSLINETEMIIHFIKHLVRITLRRNSFYVTLGIGRLLYNYRTTQVMDIYGVVIQDPDRVKDDYYYRSRKGVLMRELRERFGNLVGTYRGSHGEEIFRCKYVSRWHLDMVKECLSVFTPWDTSCILPTSFAPFMEELKGFSSTVPNEEDIIEVNRIHAILHPGCFRRVVDALGFVLNDQEITIPQFFLSNNNEGPRSDRYFPLEPNEDLLNIIKRKIQEQTAQRRMFMPNPYVWS